MKAINEMNQKELVDYAIELEGEDVGRTFEESVEIYRAEGNEKMATIFQAMVDRWWDIEDGE